MEIMDFVYYALFFIITYFGIALLSKFILFLNKKIDEVQCKTKLSNFTLLNTYIDKFQNEVISKAVLTVAQEYVDSLKESGSFNLDAQKIAKDKAIIIVKSLLNSETEIAIKTLYTDLELFISSSIESFISKNK